MSKYLSFTEIVFKDRQTLIAALSDIGCSRIKQGDALRMGRYWHEQKSQTADIIIPRHSIGNSFGDIGFVHHADGSYSPVIDDLDSERALGGKFISRLRAAYNERVVVQVTARVRGTMHRIESGNVLKIKVRF
jgi:hypothetical protein